MENQEKDFFEHIKKGLHSSQEPYKEGAWEQFLLHEKKKKGRIVPLFYNHLKMVVAAAVLLTLGISGYLFYTQKSDTTIVVPKDFATTLPKDKTDKIVTPQNDTIAETATKQDINHPSLKQQIAQTNHHINKKDNNTIVQKEGVINTPIDIIDKKDQNIEIAKQEGNDKKTDEIITKDKTAAPIQNQAQQTLTDWATTPSKKMEQEYGSRWSPSFYVAPLMNETGVNMSYGLGIDYAINSKIKISAGIEYAQLKSEVNTSTIANNLVPQPNTMVKQADNTVNRAAPTSSTNYQINNAINGINIPLSFTYNMSNKLYATTGVSGLVVLANKGNISFTSINNERITVSTNKGQVVEEKEMTLTNKISGSDLKFYENADLRLGSDLNSVNLQKNNSFIPFYNAAIGIKQNIGKHNTIAIEPFIQVPLIQNKATQYSGGGVKLKLNL